ncbi:hypothetical protein, partial [Paramaledivibacter caminithermalis]
MLKFYNKISNLYKKIELITEDIDEYADLLKISRQEAEEDIKYFKKMKDRSSLGEKNPRTFIINKYTKILKDVYEIKEEAVKDIIDFENIENNNVYIQFELLIESK